MLSLLWFTSPHGYEHPKRVWRAVPADRRLLMSVRLRATVKMHIALAAPVITNMY